MTGRQVYWRVEHHLEENLLSRHRTLAPRDLSRRRMDAFDHRVGRLEMRINECGCELQASVRAAALRKRVVRRRVHSGRHLGRARSVRVLREHAVDLNCHVAYLAMTT